MDFSVLGVLEFSSVAVGIRALDEMVKKAPIKIVDAKTVCPGKYIIVFSGDVASVEASFKQGKDAGNGFLVDELFLPMVHEDVAKAIGTVVKIDNWDAAGIIETYSVIGSIEAGDAAAKAGGVKITEIRLTMGLGGKSYVKMIGSLDAVEAAMKAGTEAVRKKGLLCMDIILPQPDEQIKSYFYQ